MSAFFTGTKQRESDERPHKALLKCPLIWRSEFWHLQGGHDAGDHPPITPVASATEAELGGGDDWRLYDYIARHFLGSLSADCLFRRTTISFAAGGERFSASGVAPLRAGFTAVMPWKVPLLGL